MSDLKRDILNVLEQSEDMKLRDLIDAVSDFTFYPGSRKIRKAIEELRNDGEPIGSSATRGYFVIRTEKDFDEAVHEFRSKAMSCLKMYQRLMQIGTEMFSRQIGMDFRDQIEQLQGEGDRHGSEPSGATSS